MSSENPCMSSWIQLNLRLDTYIFITWTNELFFLLDPFGFSQPLVIRRA